MDDNIYKDVIEYLNVKADRNYKYTTTKTKDSIKARMNEGFELEDFKNVIDIKVKSWKGDIKMDKFLRPETLFGNKFESYLNEDTTVKASSKGEVKKTGFHNFVGRSENYGDSEIDTIAYGKRARARDRYSEQGIIKTPGTETIEQWESRIRNL